MLNWPLRFVKNLLILKKQYVPLDWKKEWIIFQASSLAENSSAWQLPVLLRKNPKLLLCDEPTGALDYKTGKQVLKVLQDTCRKQKKTVIVITHNLALTPMGDKIIKVKSGKIDSIEINKNPMDVDAIEY